MVSAGLVTDSPDATRRLYELKSDGFVSLRAYFDDFWSAALAEFRHRAESPRRKKKRSA